MIYFGNKDYYDEQHNEILQKLRNPYTLKQLLGKLDPNTGGYILACQEFPKKWKEESVPNGWSMKNSDKELSLLTYFPKDGEVKTPTENGEVKTLIGKMEGFQFPEGTGLDGKNYKEIVKKMMYCHFNQLKLVVVNMHFPSIWEKKKNGETLYDLTNIKLPKVFRFLQKKMVEKKSEFRDCEFVFMGDTNMADERVNKEQKRSFDEPADLISVYPNNLKLTTRKMRTILQSQISKVNEEVKACKDIIALLDAPPAGT